ncbi:MAG TPA: hypothetical protein VD815_02675 [Candidatus Saccharimonadales bacterium]|nr:hypothetical protein [Candidatus Saccharimonadales bacterium]
MRNFYFKLLLHFDHRARKEKIKIIYSGIISLSIFVKSEKAILTICVIILVIAILILLSNSSIFIHYPDQFGGPYIPDSSDEPFSSIPDEDLRSYDSEFGG